MQVPSEYTISPPKYVAIRSRQRHILRSLSGVIRGINSRSPPRPLRRTYQQLSLFLWILDFAHISLHFSALRSPPEYPVSACHTCHTCRITPNPNFSRRPSPIAPPPLRAQASLLLHTSQTANKSPIIYRPLHSPCLNPPNSPSSRLLSTTPRRTST